MTTTTATIAPTAPAPKKELEQEITFSWRNVFRRWGQNLKDDIDPALTGAKMGAYIHAIPTWHREFSEGKMRSSHRFISGLSALVIGGTEAAAYYAGAQVVDQQFASTGVSHIGYIAVGTALIATNTLSWGYEAFRRAKKTENSNVIMARIERAIERPTTDGTYDLTIARMKDALAQDLYAAKERETDEELAKCRRQRGRDDLQDLELRMTTQLQQYKEKIDEYVRDAILDTAYDVFGGLVADRQLGGQYEMTADLCTGPIKRKTERRRESGCRNDMLVHPTALSDLIKRTVKEKGGTANIELFGTMTATYGGKDRQHTGYQVAPNKKIWR